MPIVHEYVIVLIKIFNFFQKNMNKIYTFFLLIFSFFIFSHTNALQEYSLGSTAQWGNLQYAYNQGTSTRFLLVREVG